MRLFSALIACIFLTGNAKFVDTHLPSIASVSTAIPLVPIKCESGHYKGPLAGETTFTSDPWLWVVSPEFAERFCMPQKFVNKELKGAEAVAFRLVQKSDAKKCQNKNGKVTCFAEKIVRFEVYLKSDANLPKRHQGKYFQRSDIPSAKLFSISEKERAMLGKEANESLEAALVPHFESTQVGVYMTTGGLILGSGLALYEETHKSSIFKGLDYFAFEGASGFFSKKNNPLMLDKRLAIIFKQIARDKSKALTMQPLTAMAYSIELPQHFASQLASIDSIYGFNTIPQQP